MIDGRTVIEQLGGSRFIAMTGAKNFGTTDNALSFKIGRNARGVSHVRVTLDPSDTYTVEFLKVRKLHVTVAETCTDIYCDSLQDCFTRNTGMDTHL
jgi:hypothetical protein